MPCMKILLQDKASGLYYQNPEHWVSEPGEACHFTRTTQALRLLDQRKLTGVQLVLTFENDGAFVPIPLEGQALRVG